MLAGAGTGQARLAAWPAPDAGKHAPMVPLLDLAKRVLLVLNRSGVDYALCGGLAVGVHGHVRATEDIDVVIADGAQRERALAALAGDGWIEQPPWPDFADGFNLRRLIMPDADGIGVLDLLVPPAGHPCLRDRRLSELDGCACWVMDRRQLAAMKRGAGRRKDLDDAERLA